MIRMFPRRRSQIQVSAGYDEVLFGISLPSDARLNGMKAEVHVLTESGFAIGTAAMFAIEGYILPVLDPDAAATLQTIWNTLVPKDDDTDTIDLDTSAEDATSFYEPGEASMAEVMDVGLQPERIYHSQRLKSWADAPFRERDTTLKWNLSDVFKIRVGKKRYHCKGPSVVVFALASPDLLDTTATVEAALAENEWPRVKYMETVLEQALMSHFGLTEAGATTPWVDAAQLLRKYIEPDVYEEEAGAWGNGFIKAFCNVTFDVSVPGRMDKIQIGTGG